LLLIAVSCDDAESPTQPASGSGAGLAAVSLAIGNEWNYEGVAISRIEFDDASPTDTLEILTERTDEIVGQENRFAREYYLLEESLFERIGGEADIDTTYWWQRVRQSPRGLFEADISLNEPPLAASAVTTRSHDTGRATAAWDRISTRLGDAQVAAFRDAWERVQALRRMSMRLAPIMQFAGDDWAAAKDLTRLSYPVRVGKEWTIRSTPLFATTVEAIESLDLPGGEQEAYRLRITSELFGANDSVVVWYGKDGFLGHSFHMEAVATDPYGDPIGRILWDEELRLQTFATGSLSGRIPDLSRN
jgi:hypothetical protein